MAKDTAQFFHFPVSFLSTVYTKGVKDATQDAIDYAIYSFSMELELGDSIQRFIAAANHFGLNFSHPESSGRNGMRLYNNNRNKVMVSINKDIVLDFNWNAKTDREIHCFCLYAATRSILGRKAYVKVTNDFLTARMFGLGSVAEANVQFRSRNLVKRLTSRYYLDKLKNDLQDSWGLKLYARHTRGMYISYSIDYEALVMHAERNRKAFKAKERKRQENEVLAKVLAQLATE
jgi:hypothetical protein